MVPKGMVTTYKEIGNALHGNGMIYRAVGAALHKNPDAPIVPCHRVVASDGSIGGFAHGSARKKELLQSEGIYFDDDMIRDFDSVLWRFD